jgi:hypothetical protein
LMHFAYRHVVISYMSLTIPGNGDHPGSPPGSQLYLHSAAHAFPGLWPSTRYFLHTIGWFFYTRSFTVQ